MKNITEHVSEQHKHTETKITKQKKLDKTTHAEHTKLKQGKRLTEKQKQNTH